MVRKQIRYNHIRSGQNIECNEWLFLIINNNREILKIEQKIYNILFPIVEEFRTIEGKIKGTGLRYKLINFDSPKKVENSEIKELEQKVTEDDRLYSRSKGDIEVYLSKFVNKKD